MKASENSGLLGILRMGLTNVAKQTGSAIGVLPGFMLFILGVLHILSSIFIESLTLLFAVGFLLGSLWDFGLFAKRRGSAPRTVSWPTRFLGVMAGLFLIALTGGAYSPLHGLIYAAGIVSYPGAKRVPTFLLLGLLLLSELTLLIEAKQFEQIPVSLLLIGAVFALPWIFLRKQRAYLEQEQKAYLENTASRIYQEASAYRLRPAVTNLLETIQALEESELIRMKGSLLVIEQTQQQVLHLLHQALKLHSAVLVWLDETVQVFHTKAYSTESKVALEERFPCGLGALGTILKHQNSCQLSFPKISHLPYYRQGDDLDQIGSFLGIPLLSSKGSLMGILCLDRLVDPKTRDASPFSEAEQALGERAALQLLSSLQSERLFVVAERSRDAQARLYQASIELNRALTLAEVYQTTFFAMEQICSFDFAAITGYDSSSKQHSIVALQGEKFLSNPGLELSSFSFSENSSLVSMVIKNQLCLPEPNVSYSAEIPLFDPQIRLRNLPSILVLPLFRGERPTGTLVLGSQKAQHFGKVQRELLGIMANQVAVAVENALCYQSMEAMATIDGLTRLLNRKTWQERFSEMLERARRHDQPLTLLLVDVDYFKRINSTLR